MMVNDNAAGWWAGLAVSWVGFLMVMVAESVLSVMHDRGTENRTESLDVAEKVCFGVGYGLHFTGMLALLIWHHSSRTRALLRSMLGYTGVSVVFVVVATVMYFVQVKDPVIEGGRNLQSDTAVALFVIIAFGMFHALGAGVLLGRGAVVELETVHARRSGEISALLAKDADHPDSPGHRSNAESFLPEGATSPYLLYWAMYTLTWVLYGAMVCIGTAIAFQKDLDDKDNNLYVALYAVTALTLVTCIISLYPYYTKLNRRRLYRRFAYKTFHLVLTLSVVFYFVCFAGSFRQPGYKGLLSDGFFMVVYSGLWMVGAFLTFGFVECYRRSWGHYPFDDKSNIERQPSVCVRLA